MTDPLACKVCPFLHPERWLSLGELYEFEKLDRHLQTNGKLPAQSVPKYLRLHQRRYFAPQSLPLKGEQPQGAA